MGIVPPPWGGAAVPEHAATSPSSEITAGTEVEGGHEEVVWLATKWKQPAKMIDVYLRAIVNRYMRVDSREIQIFVG